MQMHEAKQVVQVVGAGNANTKLAAGWTLLAVVSADVVKSETPSAIYVLGKADPIEKDVSQMTVQELQDLAKIDG